MKKEIKNFLPLYDDKAAFQLHIQCLGCVIEFEKCDKM